ncbi:hypothetical protein DFQ26_005089 [Actinomortierella ambigua]|nr:hypothetical protein DFQ26_005089 [Actinomortierella ambigua]
MLLSSRRDIGARVRDEDDEEEELVNVGCDHSIVFEQSAPRTDTGTTGMTVKNVPSVVASSSSSSAADKRQQRHPSAVSKCPSTSSECSTNHVPASSGSCMQSDFEGQNNLLEMQQGIRRARPTRTVSASGYHPDIASSSFPPSPPGTHRRSRPPARSSFFFSPCDLSTDSSSESEREEGTTGRRPKATPKVSFFRTPGNDYPRAPTAATSSRSRRGRCHSASMTEPLSEASMSSFHAALTSSLSMSSDSFSTHAGSLASTTPSFRVPNLSQESSHPAILPFSTMVDLATAKAENITGVYFAKQMNASLRRSLPSLSTSMPPVSSPLLVKRSKPMIVDPMATGDTKGATIPRESPPGSPLTPVPGPSPELPVHPFAFDTRSTLTSSLSAPSAINNIQIASPPSSASPTKSMAIETATTMTDGGEPAQKKTLATKGKCMMFEQGHPVEMNTFAQPETRARTPVTVDVHSSLPPLPPTLGSLTTSWTDAHTVEAHKDGSPATNARRTRIATCSGPIGGGMARSGRTVPLAGSTNISQSLPTSSSMSSLGLETNDAQFNLALCYEHGQGGVDQDLGKAIHFYQQAAAQGHSKASYNLGCICFHRGLVHRAIGWFELASKCRVRDLEAIRRAEQDMDDDRGQPSSQQSMTDDVDMCPPWKTNYLAALSGNGGDFWSHGSVSPGDANAGVAVPPGRSFNRYDHYYHCYQDDRGGESN